MFYAQFVLAKKGPLSKIWLAAHWEKKLTKSQIFETDVPLAIEEVMQPKVKMALRTVGHLLLGIVRIYSKKTRYLLADTNEAFLKMRLNFRNGFQIEIDDILAEDEGENMDMYDEVNMTIPEFMDVDLDERALQANLSRLEDITLKDDRDLNSVFSKLKCVELDNFGGQRIDDFGEFEQIYGSFPSSSIQTPDGSVHRMEASSIQEAREGETTSGNVDRIGSDTVLLDVDDSVLGRSLFERKPLAAGDGELFNSMVDDVPQEAPGDDFQHDLDDNVYGAMGDFGSPPAEQQDGGNRGSFALEPLNMSHIEGKKGRKNKRTRNLLVDDNTTMPNDFIKSQMEDFRDILTTITMAPPSRKMLKMCVTGDLNYLMNEPGTNMGNKEMKTIYRDHLVQMAYKPDISVDGEECPSSGKQSQPWDDLGLVDDISDDVSIELGDNRPDSRIHDFIQDDLPMDFDLYPPVDVHHNGTLECVEDGNRSGILPNRVDEFGGFGFNTGENKENQEEEDYSDPFSLSSNSSKGKLEAYGFGSAVKKAIYEDGKWEKRSKQILKKISSEIESSEVVTFSTIVGSAKNRKQAAEQFYSLLTLAKSQAISVDQTEPFGEILIRSGEHLADHIASIDKSGTAAGLSRTPLRAI